MPARLPFTTRLRRSRFTVWLGAWLTLLQAIAMADHLSALAADANGERPGGTLGMLNICSPLPAPGASADGSKSAPAGSGTAFCAICGTASAAGNAICGGAALVALPAWIIAAAHALPRVDRAASAASRRYGAVRGPPAPFSA